MTPGNEKLKQSLLYGSAASALVVAEARAAKAKLAAQFGDKPVNVPSDERFTQTEYLEAIVNRTTGPRSQRPTFRAVLKTIRRKRAGLSLNGSWRSWAAL